MTKHRDKGDNSMVALFLMDARDGSRVLLLCIHFSCFVKNPGQAVFLSSVIHYVATRLFELVVFLLLLEQYSTVHVAVF